MTVQEERNLLTPINCFECDKPIRRNNWTLDRIYNSKGHYYDNLRLCCRICNDVKKTKENRLLSLDIEAHEKGENKEHHMYNYSFVDIYLDILKKEEYQNLYDNAIYYYGENALEELDNYLLTLSDSIKEDTYIPLEKWTKWYKKNQYGKDLSKLLADFCEKANGVINDEKRITKLIKKHNKDKNELPDKKIKIKRSKIVNDIKVKIFAFHGSTYDYQPIWKSKRLQFESMIERFGFILITLKGGYIEFLDSSRFVGQTGTLAKLCEDFKLPKKYSRTDFPH